MRASSRALNAQMAERCSIEEFINKHKTKQMVYARMAAQAVIQVNEEGDWIGTTSKYCANAIKDEEGEDKRRT
jgi:hypothetical protein